MLSATTGLGCGLFLTKLTPWITGEVDVPKASVLGLLSTSIGLIFISFCGCSSAGKLSPRSLVVYSLIFLVMAALTLSSTIVIIKFGVSVAGQAEQVINKLIDSYPSAYVTGRVDELQSQLKCCGSKSLDSWDNWKKEHHNSYPDSCCDDRSRPCFQPFQETCKTAVSKLFKSACFVIAFSGISAIIVLFASCISSCVFACTMNRAKSSILNTSLSSTRSDI